MTLFELQQEHASITQAFYVDKTMDKETFARAHLINALRQCLLSGAEQSVKDEAQAKLDDIIG